MSFWAPIPHPRKRQIRWPDVCFGFISNNKHVEGQTKDQCLQETNTTVSVCTGLMCKALLDCLVINVSAITAAPPGPWCKVNTYTVLLWDLDKHVHVHMSVHKVSGDMIAFFSLWKPNC